MPLLVLRFGKLLHATKRLSVHQGTKNLMTDGLPEQLENSDQGFRFEPLVRTLIVCFSAVALLVAGYLLYTSLAKSGQPMGCGEESGCAEVLTSRWSQVLGIPVSLPAGLAYVGVIAVTVLLPRLSSTSRGNALKLLGTLALILMLAAIWFVGLQVLYLKAICPWCMAEHSLGLIVGVLALVLVTLSVPSTKLFAPSILAASLLGVFIVAQAIGPYSAPTADRMFAAAGDSDAGAGDSRQVSLLDGKFSIRPAALPLSGSLDAENLIVVLFDYCCPHCRATHGYLLNAIEKHPAKLSFVSLPSPLNSDCNPHWKKTKKRFLESCDLAKLALAVYRTDASKFPEFDRWLFESELPRKLVEARAQAEGLIGETELAKALEDPWIEQLMLKNTTAYRDSQAERLPVLLSPGFAAVVGRPGSEEEFKEILKQDFDLSDD